MRNPLPLLFSPSVWGSSNAQPVIPMFELQAEPVGNNTGSPSATLNLLSTNGLEQDPTETGLSINQSGVITFAPGQSFPGTEFTGNVGIGTASPTAPLNIAAGSVSANNQISNALTLQPAGGAAYGNNGSSIFLDAVTNDGINPVAGLWSSLDTGGNGGVNYGGSLVLGSTPQGSATPVERMRINYLGNVGIGTTAPGAKLEVDGSIKLTANSGASLIFPDGTPQTTAWNGTLCGGDYAESVDVAGARAQYEPGDAIVVDPANPGGFLKSAEPYSTLVAGIYSTKPGVLGRRSTDPDKLREQIPMAMVGIVPAKISAENGPVKPGDLLVTSSTPGYIMKGTDRERMMGAIVGKALGSVPADTAVIEVLVSLQ